MKRSLVVAALLAAALVLSACTGKDAVNQTAGGQFRFVSGNSLGKTYDIAKRKAAGDFTGNLLNGGTLKLSQDAGKVVVINFWATWCGPCTTETPQFDAVYRTNQSKGVDFIGIDTKDIRNKAQAFVKDNNITYPIVFDEQSETALALGKIPALSLPFTVLIDRKQRIAAVYLMTLSAKDLQPVLDKLLAET
ncbi:MAG TPA: TlpA disulfide reductase family protein [Jatrophihabitantaceae bacterium]|jgi:peroxiredoxin|nr:TlpA disulfide reductase family protein [Jatrophihabitantaceae bacterium]